MQKIVAVALGLTLWTSFSFAGTSEVSSAIHEVKFNHGILTTVRDASTFVHSLELLRSDNAQEVEAFMEHKMDEIVCGTWGYLDEMNSAQRSMVMREFQRIKAYREKHPRDAKLRVNPAEFSDLFRPFDESLAICADNVLSNLPLD